LQKLSKIPIESIRLDRNSNIPLHHQLYEILRTRLDDDEFASGEKFYTEADLMDFFKISRNTARQVLTRLSEEKFIVRERGKGTIVAEPCLEQSLSKIVSFTDEMQRRGLRPETILLSQEIVKPSEKQIEALKISEDTDLVCIKRLRLGDKIPICIEESYLVKAYFPDIFNYDYSKYPLKKSIESILGTRLDFAQQKIKAINAPKELADLLDIPEKSALLYIERITFSSSIPLEFLKIFYRGDRFTLYNDLVG